MFLGYLGPVEKFTGSRTMSSGWFRNSSTVVVVLLVDIVNGDEVSSCCTKYLVTFQHKELSRAADVRLKTIQVALSVMIITP